MENSAKNETAEPKKPENTAAGEPEPKGTPSSERYEGETVHHRETHVPEKSDGQPAHRDKANPAGG